MERDKDNSIQFYIVNDTVVSIRGVINIIIITCTSSSNIWVALNQKNQWKHYTIANTYTKSGTHII